VHGRRQHVLPMTPSLAVVADAGEGGLPDPARPILEPLGQELQRHRLVAHPGKAQHRAAEPSVGGEPLELWTRERGTKPQERIQDGPGEISVRGIEGCAEPRHRLLAAELAERHGGGHPGVGIAVCKPSPERENRPPISQVSQDLGRCGAHLGRWALERLGERAQGRGPHEDERLARRRP